MNFNPANVFQVQLQHEEGCNTPDPVIMEQVAYNIRRQLPQIRPHTPNTKIVALVCGGPSLVETEKELVEASWGGAVVVAVNGAYQWCIDRNIRPSAFIMLDAREFNSRFVETPVIGCKYMLASQCHPKTFDLCRDRETLIWHACSAGQPEVDLLAEYYFKRTTPVTLGTTVAIRAISLLRLVGFQSFDIFGLDSCWLGDKHHGYSQQENDGDKRIRTWLRPKDRDDKVQEFWCAPWHMKQCDDFMNLIRERGNGFRLSVRGPGLLASILRTGAELEMEKDVTAN